MKSNIPPIIAFTITIAGIWLSYNYVSPISFFILSGIILSVLYWFYLFLKVKKKTDLKEQSSEFTLASVCCLLILFPISLLVMRNYQLPREADPYYNNTDHHAIENYGVSFNKSLTLYKDDNDPDNGLFPSDTGSFSISVSENSTAFTFQNFFTPVFKKNGKNTHDLLNSLFKEPVSPGMLLTDNNSTLRFTYLNSFIDNDASTFDITLLFTSNDKDLLGDSYENNRQLADTIVIKNLALKKGLDLRSVLLKAEAGSIGKREYVFKWIDHFSKIYLLTIKDSKTAGHSLSLFPGHDFFSTAKVMKEHQLLLPQREHKFKGDTLEEFYVGLEHSLTPYKLRKKDITEKYIPNDAGYVLDMEGMNCFPLSNITDETRKIGNTEICFLKNSYTDLGFDEIRQGFLFHDNIKSNEYTRFNALLEYSIGQPGSDLSWKIHNLGKKQSASQQSFFLQSDNGDVNWLFRFHNFSNNKFGFNYCVLYLGLAMLCILALVVLTPGENVRFIETPVLIVTYLFFTYRLLLMWRVATFPPVENIRRFNFDYLREFDLSIFGITPGLPVSLCFIIAALAFVFIYRLPKWELPKWPFIIKTQLFLEKTKGKIQSRFSPSNWLSHLLVLVGATLILVAIKEEVVKRIASIIIPCISYFYFSYRTIKNRDIIKYHAPAIKSRIIEVAYGLLTDWIHTPQFFLSLFTLAFFAFWDTGFAILFLFFLIIKNVIFNFIRYTIEGEKNKKIPLQWVHGFIALGLLYVLILDKTIFSFLLNNKTGVLLTMMITAIIAVLVLKRRISSVISWALVPALILILFAIPGYKKSIEEKIDHKVRHVVYRTSILFEPVENMLFDYEFNSSKEQKIIETAQNQWYINSYLDPEKTSFTEGKTINLRPHFSKGVDYITQTRDVVLPRYVIAEFGGLTMMLLLLAVSLPMLLFYFAYQLTENKGYQAGAAIGNMVLIFLFAIAFVVWLASTNRFAFFGQDFPFLSLTSRISTLLPVSLIVILLLQQPELKQKKLKWFFPLLITAALITAIGISGKSKLIPAGRFTINFSGVEKRLAEINEIYSDVQHTEKINYANVSGETLNNNPDLFINTVHQSLTRLYADERFKQIYEDSCTRYEKSILDSLRSNPKSGFNLGSPVHLKYDNGELNFAFNRYFRMELPAYEIKNAWKGDIAQESIPGDSASQEPRYYSTLDEKAEMFIIPPSYLLPKNGPVGLFNLKGAGPRNYLVSLVYNGATKQLINLDPGSFVKVLNNRDIVFLKDASQRYQGNLTINEKEQPYFAYNFEINGKQNHIYPLGKRFYWIRYWTSLNKKYFESHQQLNSNTAITIDYKLTDAVGRYIQNGLQKFEGKIPELNFSVMAADGNGKIRLMSDFAMRRELLDPNDTREIAEKEKEEYFIVNKEAERLQWGNLNLLRLSKGPGSSIKPIIAAAVTSQLNLNWAQMEYIGNGQLDVVNKMVKVPYYAGLELKNPWVLEQYHNNSTSFISYIKYSNNLFHSLLMFLGSYQKDDFLVPGEQRYSISQVATLNPENQRCSFPKLKMEGRDLYLRSQQHWPVTQSFAGNGNQNTYFGNTKSLISRGLSANFQLFCEPTNKYSNSNQKHNFSLTLPDSLTEGAWAFPEESYFLQNRRASADLNINFFRGLSQPTLGGIPYEITPFKMLEMYGALASLKNQYQLTIDQRKIAREDWNYDNDTWSSLDDYKTFVSGNVIAGMKAVLINGGTADTLFGTPNTNIYEGYHIYAKTGTIGVQSAGENSKRFAVIISKTALETGDLSNNRFYVVYFTINNAYKNFATGQDKIWFWKYYRNIIYQIIHSASFEAYMK